MIDLDTQIEHSFADDSVKTILRQIVSALNTLDRASGERSSDLVFTSGSVVVKGTDGKLYRMGVKLSDGTAVGAGKPVATVTLAGKSGG